MRGEQQLKQNALNMAAVIRQNRALVLGCIREASISRADIAKNTHLSKSSVTTITNEFIAEGLVREIGTTDSQMGRKPILLDIHAAHRFVIGIYLHRALLSVVLTDLKMQLIGRTQAPTEDFPDADAILRWVHDSANALIAENHLDPATCIGIGCSCPGPLDYRTGMVLTPPNFPLFHHFPLAERLQEHFHKPVFVENNAVLLASTEYRLQKLHQYKQILFLVIQDGIGSALLANGQIVRGASGFAGEIGHTSIDLYGEPCPCGNRGCLEQYLTLKALKMRFGFTDYAKIVDDAYAGETNAAEILEYSAEHLACALINSIHLLDLDAIILYGELNYRPERLLERLREALQKRSVLFRSHPIALFPSKITPATADIASTSRILDEYFQQKLDDGRSAD